MAYTWPIELILQIQHFYFLRDCILSYFSSSKMAGRAINEQFIHEKSVFL